MDGGKVLGKIEIMNIVLGVVYVASVTVTFRNSDYR